MEMESEFYNLTSGTKTGIGIGVMGLLVGAGAALGLSTTGKLIIVGGMLVVGLIVVGFMFLMKWRSNKKFAAGDDAIQDEMRKRPRKMNNPEALAKVADLSKRFERGVTMYKQATGQRLTECPWYLFTGTPGSGKTEAIRHCGIGMPDGLHEEQQGAGGTVNMDWWFTDDAIILDTAGRYLTDVDSTSEWEEFLKLLNRARPDAPINGMLVALPADSLLKDSSEEVQRKGTEIAKFLDRVRRTLGVRFPVFIVITKSDLIPGFREFFSHVSDMDLQAQIVGWSKPGDLDEAFEPDDVGEYLDTLRNTLIRRRMGLLVDPVHTEDASGRRLDQVDSLYMFPDSLLGIGPRLQRYLQMVFVKSKFNQNPLFLRGIYFTQAFEEGAALDEALARIRNVSLEQLEAEGRGWRRDRALFLRDLFEKKVFKECGLVTRASNTGQLKRNRKLTLIGGGFAALAVLGVFGYFSYQKLGLAIGKESDFWAAVRHTEPKMPTNLDLIARSGNSGFDYVGSKAAPISKNFEVVPASFFGDRGVSTTTQIDSDVEVPRLFKVLLPFQNFNAGRRSAFQVLFNQHVLVPLVQDTCDKLRSTPVPPATAKDSPWTKDGLATNALVEMLKLESVLNGATLPDTFKLAPLYQFLQPTPMPDDDTIAKLQSTFDTIYGNDGSAQNKDFKLSLNKSLEGARAYVDSGVRIAVTNCTQYWANRHKSAGNIDEAKTAIEKFDDWRQSVDGLNSFEKLAGPQPQTPQDYVTKLQAWNEVWEPYNAKLQVLQAFLHGYSPDHWRKGGVLSFKDNYTSAVNEQTLYAQEVYTKCQAAILSQTGNLADVLKFAKTSFTTHPQDAEADADQQRLLTTAERCDKMGAAPYADRNKNQRLAYEIIEDLYAKANAALPVIDDTLDTTPKIQQWVDSAKTFDIARGDVGDFPTDPTADPALKSMAALYTYMISPVTKYLQVQDELNNMPATAAGLEKQITDHANPALAKTYDLWLVSKKVKFDPKFNPDDVANLILKWNAVKEQIVPPAPAAGAAAPPVVQVPLLQSLESICNDRQIAVDTLTSEYFGYWTQVDAQLAPSKESSGMVTWAKVGEKMADLDIEVQNVNGVLSRFYTAQIAALSNKFITSTGSGDDIGQKVTTLEGYKQKCTGVEATTFNDACAATKDNWATLARQTAPAAQLAVLKMEAKDFYKDYFGARDVPYWKDIGVIALDALTNEAYADTMTKLNDFNSQCSRFPLVSNSNPLKNPVAKADDATEILAKLPTTVLDGTPAPETIGGGATINSPKIDKDLNSLRILALSPKQKLQKQILTSLSQPGATVSITFLPRAGNVKEEPTGLIKPRLKEPEAQWQEVLIREHILDPDNPGSDIAPHSDPPSWNYNGSYICGESKAGSCDPFPMQLEGGLTIVFNKNRGDFMADRDKSLLNARHYPGPWPFISMMLNDHAVEVPSSAAATTKGKGTAWVVEIADPQGNSSVLLRLDFSDGVSFPNPTDWPR